MSRDEEIEYLTNYYNEYNEDGRLLKQSTSVEFLTTMKYIQQYLKNGMNILEIGAGTGRYSLALADEGYKVDAVELIEHNIDIFKSKIKPNHAITITQGDACCLDFIEDNKYDITLLLGPMYHLFDEADKTNALAEAIRVTKKGGIIFTAYISCNILIYNLFSHNDTEEYKSKGLIDEEFKPHPIPEYLFSFHNKEDIDKLMEKFDVKRLHFVGVDILHQYMKETIDTMDEHIFKDYMKFHFQMCERADIVGMSNHLLDIFKKTN